MITREQAQVMLRSGPLPVRTGASARRSMVEEALGYVGGATIVAAAVVLVAQRWPSMPVAGRATLLAATVAVLVTAGSVVRPERPMTQRLAAALWLAAVPVTGALVGVLADGVGTDDTTTLALGAAAAAAGAAVLWAARRFVVLQVAAGASCMVAVGAWVAGWSDVEALPGLAVWSVGVVWSLLVVSGVLRPRPVPLAAAGAGVLLGALSTTGTAAGTLFAVLTVAALLGAALLVREVVLLVVAGLGVLQLVPLVADRWLPDSAAAPLALIALGVLLVAAAVWLDRRRRSGTDAPREPVSLSRTLAVGSAGAVVVAVATVMALLQRAR